MNPREVKQPKRCSLKCQCYACGLRSGLRSGSFCTGGRRSGMAPAARARAKAAWLCAAVAFRGKPSPTPSPTPAQLSAFGSSLSLAVLPVLSLRTGEPSMPSPDICQPLGALPGRGASVVSPPRGSSVVVSHAELEPKLLPGEPEPAAARGEVTTGAEAAAVGATTSAGGENGEDNLRADSGRATTGEEAPTCQLEDPVDRRRAEGGLCCCCSASISDDVEESGAEEGLGSADKDFRADTGGRPRGAGEANPGDIVAGGGDAAARGDAAAVASSGLLAELASGTRASVGVPATGNTAASSAAAFAAGRADDGVDAADDATDEHAEDSAAGSTYNGARSAAESLSCAEIGSDSAGTPGGAFQLERRGVEERAPRMAATGTAAAGGTTAALVPAAPATGFVGDSSWRNVAIMFHPPDARAGFGGEAAAGVEAASSCAAFAAGAGSDAERTGVPAAATARGGMLFRADSGVAGPASGVPVSAQLARFDSGERNDGVATAAPSVPPATGSLDKAGNAGAEASGAIVCLRPE